MTTKAYEIVEVYAVHQGDDDRHRGHPAWFFTTRWQAEDVAKGRGYFGGDAPVSIQNAVRIGDKYFLLKMDLPLEMDIGPEDQSTIRRNALAKLTETEKRLLNLS